MKSVLYSEYASRRSFLIFGSVTTTNSQGCEFAPDIAQRATSRILLMVSSGIGSGLNLRTLMRVFTSLSSMSYISCLSPIEILQLSRAGAVLRRCLGARLPYRRGAKRSSFNAGIWPKQGAAGRQD